MTSLINVELKSARIDSINLYQSIEKFWNLEIQWWKLTLQKLSTVSTIDLINVFFLEKRLINVHR